MNIIWILLVTIVAGYLIQHKVLRHLRLKQVTFRYKHLAGNASEKEIEFLKRYKPGTFDSLYVFIRRMFYQKVVFFIKRWKRDIVDLKKSFDAWKENNKKEPQTRLSTNTPITTMIDPSGLREDVMYGFEERYGNQTLLEESERIKKQSLKKREKFISSELDLKLKK